MQKHFVNSSPTSVARWRSAIHTGGFPTGCGPFAFAGLGIMPYLDMLQQPKMTLSSSTASQVNTRPNDEFNDNWAGRRGPIACSPNNPDLMPPCLPAWVSVKKRDLKTFMTWGLVSLQKTQKTRICGKTWELLSFTQRELR